MSVQNQNAGTLAQYTQPIGNALNYAYNKGSELLEKAQEPGTVQKSTQAGIRSLVGVAAIYKNPYSAGLGAILASARPGLVKQGCSMLEGAITGLWNRFSFNQKAVISTIGVGSALYLDPTRTFTILGSIFALKLGAELGLRNLRKEDVAEAQRSAAAEDIDFKTE